MDSPPCPTVARLHEEGSPRPHLEIHRLRWVAHEEHDEGAQGNSNEKVRTFSRYLHPGVGGRTLAVRTKLELGCGVVRNRWPSPSGRIGVPPPPGWPRVGKLSSVSPGYGQTRVMSACGIR
jgi:hypothetical protein